MKKLLVAAMCCMTLGLGTVWAQDNAPQGRNGRMGMRGNTNIQLADTAITNHLGLDDEQLTKIEALNASYQEQMKAQMSKRPARGAGKEEREALMNGLKQLKQEHMHQLREIMGTELYIQYLETAIERTGFRNNMNRGPQMGGGQGQHRMRGGFGGPGGGLGGDGFEPQF